jgi:hypothetical protein
MNSDADANRRSRPDRRRAPTSVWRSLAFGGRRVRVRRAAERNRPHYLDTFHWTTFMWILLLLVFSALDGLMTLELVEAGCVEVNPVMRYSLAKGPAHFLLVKYLLTAAGLPVLLLFGSRMRVGFLIPGFVALYTALIIYQLILLRQLSAGG